MKLFLQNKKFQMILIVLLSLLLAFLIFRNVYKITHQENNLPHQKQITKLNPEVLMQALSEEKYSDALKILDEDIKNFPDSLDSLIQKGIILRKLKRWDEAQIFYEKLIQKYPQCLECINNQATNFIELKLYSLAIEKLQQIIQKKSDYNEAYFNLAVAYEKNQQNTEAIKAYQDYLKLVPLNDSSREPAFARERLRQLGENG